MASSSKSATDALKYDIECPICLNIFDMPKQLNCGHVVCEDCIYRSLASQGRVCPPVSRSHAQKFKCPECRADTKIPKGGLPTNFTVKKLVAQVLEAQKEKEAGSNKSDTNTVSKQSDNGNLNCATCGKLATAAQLFLCLTCSPLVSKANALCDACRVGDGHGDHSKCFPFDLLADDDYRCVAYSKVASTLDACESDVKRASDILKRHFDRSTKFSTFSSLGQQIFETDSVSCKSDVDKLEKSALTVCHEVKEVCKNVAEMTEKCFDDFLKSLQPDLFRNTTSNGVRLEANASGDYGAVGNDASGNSTDRPTAGENADDSLDVDATCRRHSTPGNSQIRMSSSAPNSTITLSTPPRVIRYSPYDVASRNPTSTVPRSKRVQRAAVTRRRSLLRSLDPVRNLPISSNSYAYGEHRVIDGGGGGEVRHHESVDLSTLTDPEAHEDTSDTIYGESEDGPSSSRTNRGPSSTRTRVRACRQSFL